MNVKLMMLGFAHHEMILQAMFYTKQYVYPKTLFDVGYPHPDQTEKLKEACKEFGWIYQKMENLGTGANWNEAWRMLDRPDILVGVEPDERPNNKSWIARAVTCLLEDKRLGYVGMGQSHYKTMYDINPNFFLERFKVGKEILKTYKVGIGWAMGAVSKEFMQKVGMKSDPYYGNLEHLTSEAMRAAGFQWGLFDDLFSIHIEGEPLYEKWKVACADRKTTLPFEAWVTPKPVEL